MAAEASMADGFDVSVIIPTFERRELVQRAIRSVLAQSSGRHEIIVVDDGSTDGTSELLEQIYGQTIRVIRQENAGVSAARNTGMRLATAPLIALLDSDDVWHADKTRLQMAWMQAHPDHGMVLCDVRRIEEDGSEIDVFRRREVIPQDGWVLGAILRNPSLVPASTMFRREVFTDVGGFDETLRTAEDIDFHLRVASRWQIGVVERALVDAMRGHEGLSMSDHTYDDYLHVIERTMATPAAAAVPAGVRRRALAEVYARNARGMLIRHRWRDAWSLAWKSARNASSAGEYLQVAKLLPVAARRGLRMARTAVS